MGFSLEIYSEKLLIFSGNEIAALFQQFSSIVYVVGFTTLFARKIWPVVPPSSQNQWNLV